MYGPLALKFSLDEVIFKKIFVFRQKWIYKRNKIKINVTTYSLNLHRTTVSKSGECDIILAKLKMLTCS